MIDLLQNYFYTCKLNEYLKKCSKEQLEVYKRLLISLDSLDKVNTKILGSVSYCLDDEKNIRIR